MAEESKPPCPCAMCRINGLMNEFFPDTIVKADLEKRRRMMQALSVALGVILGTIPESTSDMYQCFQLADYERQQLAYHLAIQARIAAGEVVVVNYGVPAPESEIDRFVDTQPRAGEKPPKPN